MTISALIDKQDTSEIIVSTVSGILALETSSQVVLAIAAGKPNPEDWAFTVYQDRTNPWTEFDDPATELAMVNVFYAESNFPLNKSSTAGIKTQTTIRILIDIVTNGIAQEIGGGGQFPSDIIAAVNNRRIVRLVRNILMSPVYHKLGIPTVLSRWLERQEVFNPVKSDGVAIANVIATRLTLAIEAVEQTAEELFDNIEYTSHSIERASDGKVLAVVDHDSAP